MGFLSIDPEELIFENVKLGHAYTQRVTVKNPHDAQVTVGIKCSASSRYQVSPAGDINLPANGQVILTIRLKIESFPNRMRGTRGQRDSFHLKGSFFEQKFFSTFYLQKERKKTAQATTATKTEATTGSAYTVEATSSSHEGPSITQVPPQNIRIHRSGSISVAPDSSRDQLPSYDIEGDSNSKHSTVAQGSKWLSGNLGQIMAALIQRRSLYGLTIESLHEMFRTVDVNNTGSTISRNDFHAIMQRLDLGLSNDQLDTLLNAMESDSNNGVNDPNVKSSVNYNEFIDILNFCESKEGGASSPDFLAVRLKLAEDDAKQILHLSSSDEVSDSHERAPALSNSILSSTSLDRSDGEEARSQRVLSVLEAKDRVIGALNDEIARLSNSFVRGSSSAKRSKEMNEGDLVSSSSLSSIQQLQKENSLLKKKLSKFNGSLPSNVLEQKIIDLENENERMSIELKQSRQLPVTLRERAERAEENVSKLQHQLASAVNTPSGT
jgi:hypothetical protein